jgi:peptidyl-prolyl cis-trans isomerase-like protein 2
MEEKDNINWFGVKIGAENPKFDFGGGTGSGGVGKYLSLKRPQEAVATKAPEEPKKKRKVGFGDFEGW